MTGSSKVTAAPTRIGVVLGQPRQRLCPGPLRCCGVPVVRRRTVVEDDPWASLYAVRAAMPAASWASTTSVGVTSGLVEPAAMPISPKKLVDVTPKS